MTPRPFLLMVDSGSRDEPGNRYFGSLEAALEAGREYDERWQPFVWIMELRDDGRPFATHVKDGRRFDPELPGG